MQACVYPCSVLPVLIILSTVFHAHAIANAQTPPAEEMINGDLYWFRLPPELRRAIVEASSCPLHAYIQLLGLSHAIRTMIRGALHELSLPEPDPALADITPTITADALAALVGPCKSLRKLYFPEQWWDFDAVKQPGWVDEAFGGHSQLAVLALSSSLPKPDIEHILSHLPGLVELTVSLRLIMNTDLLTVLARSCPSLQVLRCSVSEPSPPDFTVLAPLSDAIKELNFTALAPLSGLPNELDLKALETTKVGLALLVHNLSAVTRLRLPRCPHAALEPLVTHLTSLELTHVLSEEDIPGPGLCRLESLSLDIARNPTDLVLTPIARLLAANRATLHSLSLRLLNAETPSLVAALRALPHLARLNLVVFDASCTLSALLSPDLVDRLERLDLDLACTVEPDPVRIVSSRLQRLRICLFMDPDSGLALDCPALVELDLSAMKNCWLTSLECPRLRTIKVLVESLGSVAPMPDLEEAVFSGRTLIEDPAWLLIGSPRLRVLSSVRLTQPDLLARLCACGSPIRLNDLRLDVTRLPNPLALRLPQLEQLDLHIEQDGRPSGGLPLQPLDLQVEAPGLLNFDLTITDKSLPSARVRLHNCPSLVRLALKSHTTLALQVDEDWAGTPAMQPRSLAVKGEHGLGTASLLDLLTRHGAQLRILAAPKLPAVRSEDWPQLVEALSALPRLTSLTLNVSKAPSPLSLACPQLRTLNMEKMPDEAKVVLACPLLEWLTGIRAQSRQVKFALPAPNLRLWGSALAS
ncbi:hypothetical protein PAPYR_547 [Paratrimastix pyriformis]|uniref:Uncharacterized protein n=1 Tax=Paratrimastix pyriformis TaxID=342808 RepID=A0ABQ8V0H1_9EUKA|nr:hypothetical protein PAPYR_547 [Paratrimastix pyriformis]